MTSDISIDQKRLEAKRLLAKRMLEEKSLQKPQADKSGLFDRIGADISKREQNIEEIKQRTKTGETGVISGGIQQAGQAAGTYADILGEFVKELTPESVMDIASKSLNKILSTAGKIPTGLEQMPTVGDVASTATKEYGQLKEQYPDPVKNIEALANVALVAAPVKKTAKPPMAETVIGKAGTSLKKSAASQAAKSREDFVYDLISPEKTKSVREDIVGRTKEVGILAQKEVVPDIRETSIANTVASIPDIKKSKTLQGNYNVINSEIAKEARSLESRLAKNNVLIPQDEFANELQLASKRLSDNPLLVGDAQVTAQKIIGKMIDIADQNGYTATGLLKSRKELDSWVKSQKGTDVFDPAKESALSIALREIRQTTNNMIDSKVPNADVKASLKKQSDLYGALENIAPKAANEASNRLTRLYQTVSGIVPVKGDIAKILGLAGVGAGAAAATASGLMPIMATGAAGYGLYKGLTSPAAKKALGDLLIKTDAAIRVSKDKEVLKNLRADRAFLIETIKGMEQEEK